MPAQVTGFSVIDALLAGDTATAGAALRTLLLPAILLGVFASPSIIKVVRSSTIRALESDYARTSRSFGYSKSSILFRDGLRNSLLPVITNIGLVAGFVLAGGNVLIEQLFAWPGIGGYAYRSLQENDLFALRGYVIFIGVAYVLINTALEFVYRWVDPGSRSRRGADTVATTGTETVPDDAVTLRGNVAGRMRLGDPMAYAAFAVLGLIIAAAVLVPPLFGTGDVAQDSEGLLPPSGEHPFGTDRYGRDVFLRCIAAARIDIALGLAVAVVVLAVGSVIGAVSATFGRVVDGVVMRVTDVLLAFPGVVLALIITASLDKNAWFAATAVVVAFLPCWSGSRVPRPWRSGRRTTSPPPGSPGRPRRGSPSPTSCRTPSSTRSCSRRSSPPGRSSTSPPCPSSVSACARRRPSGAP